MPKHTHFLLYLYTQDHGADAVRLHRACSMPFVTRVNKCQGIHFRYRFSSNLPVLSSKRTSLDSENMTKNTIYSHISNDTKMHSHHNSKQQYSSHRVKWYSWVHFWWCKWTPAPSWYHIGLPSYYCYMTILLLTIVAPAVADAKQ